MASNNLQPVAVDTATQEKTGGVTASSVPSSSHGSTTAKPPAEHDFVPQPMFHMPTHHPVELEDYFRGPRDINRHSKWPQFLRMHGSIAPKLIVPLVLLTMWATMIACVHHLVHSLAMNSVLLTVLGFLVGLALSFRSTTAYERFAEGRRYWAQLLLNGRNFARIIWVHAHERHAESAELGKHDLLSKISALQLVNAFAVALKHHLRFEPSVDYPDLAPLIGNLHTIAADADQTMLHERRMSKLKHLGQFLGVPMAESNPRKLIKRSKYNLGNTPMEILTYLSAYVECLFENGTLPIGGLQTQLTNALFNFTEVLTGCERVVNTPLPVAYSIAIAQITLAYVLMLPFQLIGTLGWVAIPATLIAGYIILGLAQIGRELENPFGMDVNDLPLDSFCHELANDLDAITAIAPPTDTSRWMRHLHSKPLWPLTGMEFKAWESRSVDDIRAALSAKATSRDVKKERMDTFLHSDHMTNAA